MMTTQTATPITLNGWYELSEENRNDIAEVFQGMVYLRLARQGNPAALAWKAGHDAEWEACKQAAQAEAEAKRAARDAIITQNDLWGLQSEIGAALLSYSSITQRALFMAYRSISYAIEKYSEFTELGFNSFVPDAVKLARHAIRRHIRETGCKEHEKVTA